MSDRYDRCPHNERPSRCVACKDCVIARLTSELAESEARVETLQNRWASRPLSHPDGEALIEENERLRGQLVAALTGLEFANVEGFWLNQSPEVLRAVCEAVARQAKRAADHPLPGGVPLDDLVREWETDPAMKAALCDARARLAAICTHPAGATVPHGDGWRCLDCGVTASSPAVQPEAAPTVEYESVGWQYKFPGIFCEWTWRDSPGSYNGSNYVDSREIFAKRTADNSAGGDNGGG